MPQSHTANQPTALRGRALKKHVHSKDIMKTIIEKQPAISTSSR